jgi:hypothetical protein
VSQGDGVGKVDVVDEDLDDDVELAPPGLGHLVRRLRDGALGLGERVVERELNLLLGLLE